MPRISSAAFRLSKRRSLAALLSVAHASLVRAPAVLDRLFVGSDGAPLHPSVAMRLLLLIAVLLVRPGVSCGPLVARTNVANTSNKARSDQRAKEENPDRQPLITWPPDDPLASTPDVPTTPELPLVTFPPSTTVPSRLHTFPPSEADGIIGNRKSLTSSKRTAASIAQLQRFQVVCPVIAPIFKILVNPPRMESIASIVPAV